MDKFQHNLGFGSIFKAKNRTSDRQPEYTGSARVAFPASPDGGEMDLDLAAWVKEGKNGKFFSLSLKEDTYNKPTSQDQGKEEIKEDMDDDLPW
jgi:hypothetical protein